MMKISPKLGILSQVVIARFFRLPCYLECSIGVLCEVLVSFTKKEVGYSLICFPTDIKSRDNVR